MSCRVTGQSTLTKKESVFALFDKLSALQDGTTEESQIYKITQNLMYLVSLVDPKHNVSIDTLYALSERLETESNLSCVICLNEERREAIRTLLESGISDYPYGTIPPEKTPDFLLCCSSFAFAYAVDEAVLKAQFGYSHSNFEHVMREEEHDKFVEDLQRFIA